MVAFEWLGPLLEAAGDSFMIVGFGLILSVGTLRLEEVSFPVYPKPTQLFVRLVMAVIENVVYQRLISLWRRWGLMKWASGTRARWGEMTRTASWRKPAGPGP